MTVRSALRARRLFLLVAALGAFAAAGCTSDDAEPADDAGGSAATPPPLTPGINPNPTTRQVCTMVSTEELKTATGIQGPGQASRSGGADVCSWFGGNGKAAVVQVWPNEASYVDARQAFEGLYAGKAEDVPDIGKKAFFIAGTTGAMTTATVASAKDNGTVSVQIMGGGMDPTELRANAVALAKVMLDKM